MATKVRVGTFNCENLFARFRFRSNVKVANATKDGFTINDLAFDFLKPDEKTLTGQAIRALDADVIALQEVENFDVLKRFRNQYLKPLKYTYGVLIEGNDPRFIDVAVLSRFPLTRIVTHQELRSGNSALFSRDCLEVDVDVKGKTLTLFVNHLKSMLDKKDPKNGRKNTRDRRLLQAKTVKHLVQDRFGTKAGSMQFVICGDLNDYVGAGQGTTDGTGPLVGWGQVENVLDRLPEAERWTHFWETRKTPDSRPESYKQLDYMLLSRSLAGKSAVPPIVVRRGLCTNAALYSGARFAGVGTSSPAASDHCPIGIDLVI